MCVEPGRLEQRRGIARALSVNPRPPASSGSTATAGSLYSSPGPANGNSLEIHDSENGLKEIGEELVICSADVLTLSRDFTFGLLPNNALYPVVEKRMLCAATGFKLGIPVALMAKTCWSSALNRPRSNGSRRLQATSGANYGEVLCFPKLRDRGEDDQWLEQRSPFRRRRVYRILGICPGPRLKAKS